MPNPKVDGWLRKSDAWRAELTALRAILLDSPLNEDVKWRHPCYTFGGANVVLLGRQNDCCVFSFVKGALLPDPAGVLEKPGEQSQSVRVVRFREAAEVARLTPTLRQYVDAAIAVERSGAKVEFKPIEAHGVPAELQAALDQRPELAAAFAKLTPGRRRGYLLHVGSAKQSKTRAARVEKCVPMILAGKGLDD